MFTNFTFISSNQKVKGGGLSKSVDLTSLLDTHVLQNHHVGQPPTLQGNVVTFEPVRVKLYQILRPLSTVMARRVLRAVTRALRMAMAPCDCLSFLLSLSEIPINTIYMF